MGSEATVGGVEVAPGITVMRCARKPCRDIPTLAPILLLYAPREHGVNKPMQARLSLTFCQACAKLVKPADLITDKGWDMIIAGIAAQNCVPPDRKRTAVAWEPIQSSVDFFKRLMMAKAPDEIPATFQLGRRTMG